MILLDSEIQIIKKELSRLKKKRKELFDVLKEKYKKSYYFDNAHYHALSIILNTYVSEYSYDAHPKLFKSYNKEYYTIEKDTTHGYGRISYNMGFICPYGIVTDVIQNYRNNTIKQIDFTSFFIHMVNNEQYRGSLNELRKMKKFELLNSYDSYLSEIFKNKDYFFDVINYPSVGVKNQFVLYIK